MSILDAVKRVCLLGGFVVVSVGVAFGLAWRADPLGHDPPQQTPQIRVRLDGELYRRVRSAAGPEGLSNWLAGAAASRLRIGALIAAIHELAQQTGRAVASLDALPRDPRIVTLVFHADALAGTIAAGASATNVKYGSRPR
jgi:hypothetical protein